MSDDRLFASNNAIGRKWYYLNMIILAIITYATQHIFENYIIPFVATEFYDLFAKIVLYFLYVMYLITFFALVERRLYDACGNREGALYRKVGDFLKFVAGYQILVLILNHIESAQTLPLPFMQDIATLLDGCFILVALFIGLLKGKVSCLTMEEYKKRDRYKL